jgi:transcriptional regulator with XRE-family HTH domain
MSAPAAHPADGDDAGQAIAAARKARGLTQRELSRQAAVSLSLLRKIEQGTAHAGMPEEAADRIAEARAVGQQVPDGVYRGTAFGPDNVRIHELALAVESGDVSHAIKLAGQWQPPRALPAERRSHFHIEAARAYCWAGHRDEAVTALWQARHAAPQHTRCSPAVGETVRILIRGSRRPPPPLLQLATWIGHV